MNAKQRKVRLKHRKKERRLREKRREQAPTAAAPPRPPRRWPPGCPPLRSTSRFPQPRSIDHYRYVLSRLSICGTAGIDTVL